MTHNYTSTNDLAEQRDCVVAQLFPLRLQRRANKLVSILAAMAFACGVPAAVADSDTTNIIVFDASGSMWNKMENSTRIEVARVVMKQFLDGYDTNQPLGVIAYGHRKRGDCNDIEVLVPPSTIDSAALSKRINALLPKGKTPLAESLRRAGEMIPRTAEDANILLITDGLETCDADPCAVAKAMVDEGIKVRAHVVGFGLTKAEANSLACIANLTGGQIFNPSNGDELLDALEQSVAAETVVTPEPDAVEEKTFEVVMQLKDIGFGLPAGFMKWTATGEAGIVRELGTHEGRGITVMLPPGTWSILAEGAEGRGEGNIIVSGPSRPYIDFTAAQVDAEILNDSALTAGVEAYIRLRIKTPPPGDAQTHFKIGVFPVDDPLKRIVASGQNRYVFAGKKIVPGDYNASVYMPKTPGRYKLAFIRTSGAVVLAEKLVDVVAVPELKLEVPDRVVAGSVFFPEITSGFANSDRLTLFAMNEDGSRGRQISSASYTAHIQTNEELIDAPATPGKYLLVLTARTADSKNSPEATAVVNVVSAEEFEASSPVVETRPASLNGVDPEANEQVLPISGEEVPEPESASAAEMQNPATGAAPTSIEPSAPVDPKAKVDVRLTVPGVAEDASVTWIINPLEPDGVTFSRDGRMGGGGNSVGGHRTIGLVPGKWKVTAKSNGVESLLIADVEPGKVGQTFTLGRQYSSRDVTLDVAETVEFLKDGFFPITLGIPDGFRGKVTLHTEANRDGAPFFETDAGALAGATDQALPMPAGPGLYELQIRDTAGERLMGIPFEVTAANDAAIEEQPNEIAAVQEGGEPTLLKYKGGKSATGTIRVDINGRNEQFVTTTEVLNSPIKKLDDPEAQKFLDSMEGKVIDTAVLRSIAGNLYVSLSAYGAVGEWGPATIGKTVTSFEVEFTLDLKTLTLKPGSRELSYRPPESRVTESRVTSDYELELDSVTRLNSGSLAFKGSFSGTLTQTVGGETLDNPVPVKGTFDILKASGNSSVSKLIIGN